MCRATAATTTCRQRPTDNELKLRNAGDENGAVLWRKPDPTKGYVELKEEEKVV